MGWIGIVLWVITHASDLIGLVKEILGLIHTLPHGQQAMAKAEIGNAVASGNPDDVKTVMQKWRDHCALSGGVGCGGGEVAQ